MERVGGVALHPQGERSHAAEREPRVERAEVESDSHGLGPGGVHKGAGADQDSGGDIAVARQVLGRAVVHRRGSVLERPEERGRREGAVHQQGDAPSARDRGQTRQVGQPQQRVRDRFDEDRPRRVREGGLHGGRLRGVCEAHADPPAPGLLPEERGGRAVEIPSDHEVLAGPEAAQEEGAQRGHPRGDDETRLATLEGRQRVLQHGVVRRPEPPVDVPRFPPFPDGVHLREVLEDVHVRHLDSGNERLRGGLRWRRRPSGSCREAQPSAHGRSRNMATLSTRPSMARRCATGHFHRRRSIFGAHH